MSARFKLNVRLPEEAPDQPISQLIVVSNGRRSDPMDVRQVPETAALAEVDLLFPHPIRKPVVLVQADSRGEGEIRAHPNEHAPSTGIVEVDTVLIYPALRDLQMPPVLLLVPVGNQDALRLAGFQEQHDLIGLGLVESRGPGTYPGGLPVPPGWAAPFLRANGYPIPELIGNVGQEPVWSDTWNILHERLCQLTLWVSSAGHW
jgi:hypothetical protein